MAKDLTKIRHELFLNSVFVDEQLFNDRIEFFKKEFHLSDAKINKLIEKSSLFLRNDPQTVQIKKAALMEHFGYTNEDMNRIFPKCQMLFNHDPQTLINSESVYMKEFGLTKAEVKKIFKVYPTLMELGDSVQDKIKFFVEDLKIERSKLTPIIKKQPTAFGYGVQAMKVKAKDYFDKFGYSYIHLGKMLLKNAGLFGYDTKTVESKKKLFKDEFGYTDSEVSKIFFDAPVLLGLEKPEIVRKHKLAKELNLDSRYILKNPTVLMAPAGSLKIRYMIMYIASGSKEFLQRNWWLTSHKVTWARLNGLHAAKAKVSPARLIASRSTFKRDTGYDSDTFVKNYPLSKNDLQTINNVYQALAKANDDLDLFVSDVEFDNIGKKKR